MKAVLVARVSTFRQADNVSKDAQLESMRGFVEGVDGEVVGSFFDSIPGTFGRYEDRKGLHEALSKLADGTADTLCVYDTSRAARDDTVFHRLLEDVYSRGGRLAIAVERQIYRTQDEASILLHWTRAVANYEVLNLKRRTQSAKQVALNKGSFVWTPLRGYKVVKRGDIKVLAPDEPVAAVINEVFSRLIEGKSKQEAAQVAHSLGYRWNTQNITKLLDDAHLYVGGSRDFTITLQGVSQTVSRTYPQLISEDMYEAVSKLPRISYRQQRRPTPYLGVLHCVCGSRAGIIRRYGNQCQLTCNTYFRAKRRKARGHEEGPAHSRSVDVSVINRGLLKYLSSDGVVKRLTKDLRDALGEYDTAPIEKQLEAAELERNTILDALMKYTDNTHIIQGFEARLAKISQQELELNSRLQRVQQSISTTTRLLDRYESIDWTKTAQSASRAIAANDWKVANEALASLGIRVTADFTQPKVRERVQIQLKL